MPEGTLRGWASVLKTSLENIAGELFVMDGVQSTYIRQDCIVTGRRRSGTYSISPFNLDIINKRRLLNIQIFQDLGEPKALCIIDSR